MFIYSLYTVYIDVCIDIDVCVDIDVCMDIDEDDSEHEADNTAFYSAFQNSLLI